MARSIESSTGQEASLEHISSFHKTPRELQTEIIKNALKSDSEPGYSISFCDEDPSLQTHPVFEVCRLWRQLAFDTPEIWSSIEVRGKLNVNQDRKLRGLRRWLERGRNFPLDIRFEATQVFNSDHLSELFSLLLAQPRRWRSLDYKGSWGGDFDVIKNRSTEFVLLSKLSVSYSSGFSQSAQPAVKFPNLQTLHLTSMAVALPIEGSSVTKLELTWVGLTLGNLQRYAEKFPNVQHLVTRESEIVYFQNDPEKDCKLFSNLRIWEWIFEPDSDLEVFHAGAIAQCHQLTTLRLEFSCRLQILPEASLLPGITQLTLVDDTTNVSSARCEYEELLQSTPNLQGLTLASNKPSRSAFYYADLLIRMGAAPVLCPQLQSLTLDNVRIDRESLLRFSRERIPYPACHITTRRCAGIPDVDSVLYPALLIQLERKGPRSSARLKHKRKV